MIGVQLLPVDTWFFRDGSPFTADAAPQTDVKSLFPPHPPTVVGALRALMARGRGWNGSEPWSQEIRDTLGDGPENLGKVSFDGPFLLRCEQPVFPAPRHLLGATGENGAWRPKAFLRPGEPVECDLGRVRLPDLSRRCGNAEILKPGDGQWLTAAGLNSALRGEVPRAGDVASSRSLWSSEYRIGLERHAGTRAAKEGMLYSSQHTRPSRAVSLGARIHGLPQDWDAPYERLTPLGGESRLAECRRWDGKLGIKSPIAKLQVSHSLAVVALTPVYIEIDLNTEIAELGGARVTSACIDRPQRIGGWYSPERRPLPIRSALPQGSVLFCETSEPERLESIISRNDGLARIGERKEWGFGLVALGVWPGRKEGA